MQTSERVPFTGSQHKDGYCILQTSARGPFITDRWILQPADLSKMTIHCRQMNTASWGTLARGPFIIDRWILHPADFSERTIHCTQMVIASCILQKENHSQHKDGYCILQISERGPFITDRWILHPADLSKMTIHCTQMVIASCILQKENHS